MIPQLGKHLRHGADDAEALVGVAHANRDRRLDDAVQAAAVELALGQLLKEAVGDVADRLAEIEDRVEDQLFLSALGADDQVVALAAAVERLVDDAVDHQHRHDQRHAQAHREDRQQARPTTVAECFARRLSRGSWEKVQGFKDVKGSGGQGQG